MHIRGRPDSVMNSCLQAALARHPERYPSRLGERYPRILDRIAELWGTTQIDQYLQELLLDTRGGRQGFAPEVMSDLMFLHGLHVEVTQAAPAGDVWGREAVRKGLVLQEATDPQLLLDRAVRDGNEMAVRRLLAGRVDVSRRNANSWTPLMVASFAGNPRVAAMLIESGADVNAQDPRGYAPLHWAAFKNYHEVVQLLLQRGAFVNIKSASGLTPLLQASAQGALQSMKLLVRFGADVNEPDNEGWTPLHKAAANDHVKAVELLADEGADWSARHRSGVTPADLARRKPQLAYFVTRRLAA
jgi:ankyrin repeat protein